MRRSITHALTASGAALVLLAATPVPAHADTGDRARGGEPPGAGLTKPAAAQTAADALGALGLATYGDVFAGLRVEPGANKVTVYATDAKRGNVLAGAGLGKLDAGLRAKTTVDVRASKYSRRQLESARAALWKQAPAGTYYTIAVPSDGSGLVVETANPQQAGQRLAGLALPQGVSSADVRFVTGKPVRPTSREDDNPPYKGGIPIEGYWDSDWRCTSAFGIRKDNKTYLVTAEHCFEPGDWVYDRNDDYLGNLSFEANIVDAAAIDTNAGAEVWIDDTQTRVYQRAALSWNGQYVCQSGFTSDKRCTIEVTHDNVEWDFQDGKGPRRGVRGWRGAGVTSVCGGDSGGPLWTYASDGRFESRGIVSGGGNQQTENPRCYEYILWTETPAVLNVLGATLITG